MKRRGKIILKDALKGYSHDLEKLISPKETLKRFRKRLKEVDMDILADTVRIDNGRLGIPVYFSICGRDAKRIIGTKKQMGKGGTPEQAEASAIMELAERFSFFSFSKDPKNFLKVSFKDIKNQKALAFEYIVRSVHDKTDRLDRVEEVFSHIPLRWTWAYNMTKSEEVLIPFDWFYLINEFNGTSAGNCNEEAICQGICEVVERHVSSIISRKRLKRPHIRVQSIKDKVSLDLINRYKRVGVNLFISDFTLDMGIPSVGVLAYDPSTYPEKSEIVWTAGTTTNPYKSLNRALTEVAQLAGDFNTSSNYVPSGLPKFKDLKEAHFVMEPSEWKDMDSLPDISDKNIKIEVESCIHALWNRGFEVIVLNITHPKLDIPAFYTIIPGAHFRERTLSDVAMTLGRVVCEIEDPESALEMLKYMDRVLPNRYFLKFYMGLCHLKISQWHRAEIAFRDALSLNPPDCDRVSIYSHLSYCLKEMSRFKEAIELCQKALEYDSDRQDLFNIMGYCYYRLKEHQKAIDCFMEAVRIDPSSAIDYANIGVNYRLLGKRDKAIAFYLLALQLDPDMEFVKEHLLSMGIDPEGEKSADAI